MDFITLRILFVACLALVLGVYNYVTANRTAAQPGEKPQLNEPGDPDRP